MIACFDCDRRAGWLLSAWLSTALCAAGCSDSNAAAAGINGPGWDTSQLAEMRVVHASPTAPALDIYPRGSVEPVVRHLAYGQVSAPFAVSSIRFGLEVRPVQSDPSVPALFIDDFLEVEPGGRYSAVAAGDWLSTEANEQFRLLVLPDGPPGSVRVVHALVDSAELSIDIGNDSASSPEVPRMKRFADASGFELPADKPVPLGLSISGHHLSDFTMPPPEAGQRALWIVTGRVTERPQSPQALSILQVLPDGSANWIRQDPWVHLLHGSPSAPVVNVFVRGQQLFADVAFGELVRAQLPPGSHKLEFFPASAAPEGPDAPVPATVRALAAGQNYLLVPTGHWGQSGPRGFQLLTLADAFGPTIAGRARMRLAHAAPDAPELDVGVLAAPGRIASGPIVESLSFAKATPAAGLQLQSDRPIPIGLTPTGQSVTVAEFELQFSSGQNVFAVAAANAPGADNGLRLLAVDATAGTLLQPWTVSTIAAVQQP